MIASPQNDVELRPTADAARERTIEVYQQFCRELLRAARGFGADAALAQDAVQETYLRYFLALVQGEAIRENRAWLHRVLHNLLIDAKRCGLKHPNISLQACSTETLETSRKPPSASPAFGFEWQRIAERVLAPREWQCMRLRAEGLEYREIATALQIRTGTVAALLNRAVSKLRAALVPVERTA